MFSVSLGAILLSLYYVFIWKNPHTQALDKKVTKERRALRYVSVSDTGTDFQDNSTDFGSGVLLPDFSSPSPEALVLDHLNLHHDDDEVLPVTAFPKKVGVAFVKKKT